MNQNNRLIRKAQLVGEGGILPFGKSTLYKLVAEGRFPKPLKIGRMTVWTEKSVQVWLDNLSLES